MFTGSRKRHLLRKMRGIFQDNKMNREEIAALLQMEKADYSDGRLNNAVDRIAELVEAESLNVEDTMELFKICYEVEFEPVTTFISSQRSIK